MQGADATYQSEPFVVSKLVLPGGEYCTLFFPQIKVGRRDSEVIKRSAFGRFGN